MSIPPPPVPQRLREMLSDYPEYIGRLQIDLASLAAKPFKGTPLFEQILWVLEDGLGEFISEARQEFEAAQASGDPEQTERAQQKLRLMFKARSGNGGMRLGLMGDIWNYCEANNAAWP